MKQILDEAKGAQEAADEAPHEGSHENQEAGYVEGPLVIPAPDDCLQGADGTGSQGARAGIAVEAGDAQVFQLSLIDSALEKAGQVAVGDKGPEKLDPVAGPFAGLAACFPGLLFLLVSFLI